jgi:exodeoxyribonuclease VII small subunit
MMTSTNSDTASFKASFQKLKSIAEQLKNQAEPNIDELIPQIEQAMQAYKICKDRLDHVSATLKNMLPEIAS